MISTHLYLVSAQATPNLTPALDSQIAPRRAILLVSSDMRSRADWLEQVLSPRGIQIDRWPLNDPWDVELVQLRLSDHRHISDTLPIGNEASDQRRDA